MDKDAATSLCDLVRDAEPETEDFATPLVSSALDAATACGMILQLLTDGEISKVVTIASLSRDTVDMFVQEADNMDPSDPNLEGRILSHPLMQRELERQNEDLRHLGDFLGTESEVAQLKAKWRNPERSNINQPGGILQDNGGG